MRSEESVNLMCEFSEVIVPYLYGEASASECERFESHVADCSACTDEFAELSFARFSVFEWQKEEFASMPTPEFVIPYDLKAAESTGFLTGLRELIAFNWATAIGACAVLTVVAGLGFVAVNYFGNSGSELAGIDEANKNISIAKPASSPLVPVTNQKVEVVSTDAKPDLQRSVVPAKASTIDHRPKRLTMSNNKVPRLVNTEAVKAPQPQDRRTPSLTVGTDEDDRSLRLTDLFDSVDTRL